MSENEESIEEEDAGYWNYRVFKDHYKDGTPLFRIIEAYYNKNNEITGWCDVSTGESTALLWDDFKDLKGTIKHLMKDVNKPILIRKEKDSDELIELKLEEEEM